MQAGVSRARTSAHLGKLEVWSHDVFDKTMPEDPQDTPDQVLPICPCASTDLSQRHDGPIHLSILIMHPRFILDPEFSISYRVDTFGRGSVGNGQPREYKDRFDSQTLQVSEVLFDTMDQSERDPACSSDEGLARVGFGEEYFDIVCSVNTESCACYSAERAGLE